jgi:hypothetical protein
MVGFAGGTLSVAPGPEYTGSGAEKDGFIWTVATGGIGCAGAVSAWRPAAANSAQEA